MTCINTSAAAVFTGLLLSATAHAAGSSWSLLPGVTIPDLLMKGIYAQTNLHASEDRLAEVVSTAGLSWPDGRQALVTYINVTYQLVGATRTGKKTSYTFRCLEYFDVDMQPTVEACYELTVHRGEN